MSAAAQFHTQLRDSCNVAAQELKKNSGSLKEFFLSDFLTTLALGTREIFYGTT